MSLHFEDIWTNAENYHKDGEPLSVSDILEELILKLNFYKAIDEKEELSNEDKRKIKSHTFGEMLFTLTALSLNDNVNTYEALNVAVVLRQFKALNVT